MVNAVTGNVFFTSLMYSTIITKSIGLMNSCQRYGFVPAFGVDVIPAGCTYIVNNIGGDESITAELCYASGIFNIGGVESVTAELCYSVGMIGPSICLIQLPNGTDVDYYCGDLYKLTYLFDNTLESSIEWGFYNTTYPNEREEVISETSVCNAKVDGLSCDTCTFCDDGSVEADCTNLELGTKVECGDFFVNSTVWSHPFYPLSGENSSNSNRIWRCDPIFESASKASGSSNKFTTTIAALVFAGSYIYIAFALV